MRANKSARDAFADPSPKQPFHRKDRMMHNKNTLSLHARIALEIKAAKKKMFKRHREGVPLQLAIDKFEGDVMRRLYSLAPETQDYAVVERDRVKREVSAVIMFFEESTPDFLRSAMIESIDLACDHFGIDRPTYDDHPITGNDQTGAILTQLFGKTRMFSLPSQPVGEDIDHVNATLENGEQVELYGDAVDVAKRKPEASQAHANAISEIINNPAAPADLHNSVADFVADLRSSRQDNSPAAIHNLLTKEARANG
jgi:hypothetical protein